MEFLGDIDDPNNWTFTYELQLHLKMTQIKSSKKKPAANVGFLKRLSV